MALRQPVHTGLNCKAGKTGCGVLAIIVEIWSQQVVQFFELIRTGVSFESHVVLARLTRTGRAGLS